MATMCTHIGIQGKNTGREGGYSVHSLKGYGVNIEGMQVVTVCAHIRIQGKHRRGKCSQRKLI